MASGQLISQLIERIARLQRAADHAEGLNPAQWEVLRYLGRANRFSNTATAVTAYLGSTKGTVSQTLNALERKGFIARNRDKISGRIVRLNVTEAGLSVLEKDPAATIRKLIDEAPSYRMRPLEEGLKQVLEGLLINQEGEYVSPCEGCKHFKRARFGAETPYICAMFGEGLSEADTHKLCAFHDPA
jgi:DNA-binding MarR family transcriptional regulator